MSRASRPRRRRRRSADLPSAGATFSAPDRSARFVGVSKRSSGDIELFYSTCGCSNSIAMWPTSSSPPLHYQCFGAIAAERQPPTPNRSEKQEIRSRAVLTACNRCTFDRAAVHNACNEGNREHRVRAWLVVPHGVAPSCAHTALRDSRFQLTKPAAKFTGRFMPPIPVRRLKPFNKLRRKAH